MERIKQFAVALVVLVLLWIAQPSSGAVSAKRALNTVLPATNLDNVSINDAIDALPGSWGYHTPDHAGEKTALTC